MDNCVVLRSGLSAAFYYLDATTHKKLHYFIIFFKKMCYYLF